MPGTDIIREYLVSLGVDFDQSSLNKMQTSLASAAKTVNSFVNSLQATAIAGGVAAGIYELGKAFEGLTLGVANATLQNEMFARQMWLNFDSAVAFKSSLDSLGVSIQDLYLSPQLMNTFIQFRDLAKEMQTPGDYQSVMNNLMGITFQFDQFKLEAGYAVQWVSYYLAKELAPALGGLKNGLQGINSYIVQHLPQIAKTIANWIAGMATFFEDIYNTGKAAIQVFDSLGSSAKDLVGIIAGVGAEIAIMGGPVTLLIDSLGALMLVIQDYYTYESGGKSALPGLWQWLDKTKKKPPRSGRLYWFYKCLGWDGYCSRRPCQSAGRIVWHGRNCPYLGEGHQNGDRRYLGCHANSRRRSGYPGSRDNDVERCVPGSQPGYRQGY